MVPADFVTYFSVLAGVGATLFGLIFVTISITPETTRTQTTSVMRQVQVASAYTALLNPLVISLLALVPHATVGTVTLIMSTIGLVNIVMMGDQPVARCAQLGEEAAEHWKIHRMVGRSVGFLTWLGTVCPVAANRSRNRCSASR